MELEQIKKRLNHLEFITSDISSCINDISDEVYEIENSIESIYDNSIRNIDNFKRELTKNGLYSKDMEEFLEIYMKFYNR